MVAAPNLGHAYKNSLRDDLSDLAEKYGVALYPFFLDGVAGRPETAARGRHAPERRGHRPDGRKGILPTVENGNWPANERLVQHCNTAFTELSKRQTLNKHLARTNDR
jgi:hypothetical protein